MNQGTLIFTGVVLVVLAASLFSLIRYAFLVAIPLALGGVLLCAVPLFFSASVASVHAAFDDFLGEPHQALPFEANIHSWPEMADRLKQLAAAAIRVESPNVSPGYLSQPSAGPMSLAAPEDPQVLAAVFFLAVFVFFFALYKMFRLAMAYLGCGLPWGRRARVEMLGMQFRFRLRYPHLIVGDMVYDFTGAERDSRNPYRYTLSSGTVLQFLKVPRKRRAAQQG